MLLSVFLFPSLLYSKFFEYLLASLITTSNDFRAHIEAKTFPPLPLKFQNHNSVNLPNLPWPPSVHRYFRSRTKKCHSLQIPNWVLHLLPAFTSSATQAIRRSLEQVSSAESPVVLINYSKTFYLANYGRDQASSALLHPLLLHLQIDCGLSTARTSTVQARVQKTRPFCHYLHLKFTTSPTNSPSWPLSFLIKMSAYLGISCLVKSLRDHACSPFYVDISSYALFPIWYCTSSTVTQQSRTSDHERVWGPWSSRACRCPPAFPPFNLLLTYPREALLCENI